MRKKEPKNSRKEVLVEIKAEKEETNLEEKKGISSDSELEEWEKSGSSMDDVRFFNDISIHESPNSHKDYRKNDYVSIHETPNSYKDYRENDNVVVILIEEGEQIIFMYVLFKKFHPKMRLMLSLSNVV
ncbi:hypothetical protein JTB14_002251 [Gonioctena quinquepunctata]|nr:hypothetical protein JTB14_002251 [Gonioctena quinquepunctata]